MAVTIRGKDKFFNQFKNNKHPYWKLTLYGDLRTMIATNMTEKNFDISFQDLSDTVENLDKENCYTIETFAVTNLKQTRPDACYSFSLNSKNSEEGAVIGRKEKPESYHSGSMKEHIALIEKNAKLEVEISTLRMRIEEYEEQIKKLKKENAELEEELDEMEEEIEEEEAIGSTDTIQSALASLIKENGAMIIENVVSKGVKKDEDNVQISGITTEKIPDLQTIINELSVYDTKLNEHLYKLLLIAKQKKHTFAYFMKKLEEF